METSLSSLIFVGSLQLWQISIYTFYDFNYDLISSKFRECYSFCPSPFAKAADIKTHLSVCLSLCLSVTKTLTWLISSEVLMIEH